ncbi:MAG TPA: hypothetical protein VG650_05595 [Mycobacteriales bacterium]|nr:hypothetical protein [Mycobacteriales bacterium]
MTELARHIADADADAIRPSDPEEAARQARISRFIVRTLVWILLVSACGTGGVLSHSAVAAGIGIGLYVLMFCGVGAAIVREVRRRRVLPAGGTRTIDQNS